MDILHKIGKFMFTWVNFEDNYGRDLIFSFLKNKDFEKVLDIGAGHGDDLNNIMKLNSKASFFAIECYKKYADELESKKIKTFNINIEKDVFPFENCSIDIIICNQVLEHTKDIFWILHECTRVLKKGGVLIIGVPNLAAWHNRLFLFLGKTPPCIELEGNHVRGFTYKNFVNFLNNSFNGYKLIKYRGAGFYPFSGVAAKFLSRIIPTFSWGMFVMLEKRIDYHGEFLDEAKKRLETNFFKNN